MITGRDTTFFCYTDVGRPQLWPIIEPYDVRKGTHY